MNSLEDIQQVRWFRSAPVSPGFSSGNIDAEAGLIRDVVMVQEGPAKGHGVHLDEEFIAALVEYDQATFSKNGLKARFGHPSASSETMGTQLGVFSNFRKRRADGKMQAIADLQLLDSADQSPTHPGMKSWVLSMSAERPDFIMSSIVFRGSGFYQRKANGHKRHIIMEEEIDPALPLYMEFDPANGAEHFYTDLVEQGAATDSLFSNKVNPDFFVSRAHDWLDDNPDILQFVKDNPQRVQFFLQRLGISIQQPQPKKMAKTSLMDWLFGKAEEKPEAAAEDLDTLKTELSAAKEAVTALQAEKDTLDNRVKDFESQVASLQANVAALKSEAETLKTDLAAKVAEIERLKAEPAAAHTGAPTEPGAGRGERAYENTEIYQRVKAMRRKPE